MHSDNLERILITGAFGFIGSRAVEYFLKRGFKVKVFSGDMRDESALLFATSHIDVVIHLAARKQDEKDSFETNVGGAQNLVAACEKNGVKFIVNVSTISTKIDNKGKYGETKDMADQIFRESKVPTTTLKASIVYGDFKNGIFGTVLKFSKLPLTPVFGSGQVLFRPIYIEDFLKAIEIAINSDKLKNKTYDAVGPELISFNSLIYLLGEKILNKKVVIVHLPVKFGIFLANILFFIFSKPPITKSNILGSIQDAAMDYESFVRDFKFEPISFAIGLEKLKAEAEEFKEAELIFNYLTSRSLGSVKVGRHGSELYNIGLSKNNIKTKISSVVYRLPFLLGPLDFLSRFYKDPSLAIRLKIGAAVLEASPTSAKWLLPKERSLFSLLFLSIYLSFSFIIKAILALLLLPFQNFIKKNVVSR